MKIDKCDIPAILRIKTYKDSGDLNRREAYEWGTLEHSIIVHILETYCHGMGRITLDELYAEVYKQYTEEEIFEALL